jgi:hypothetical protein
LGLAVAGHHEVAGAILTIYIIYLLITGLRQWYRTFPSEEAEIRKSTGADHDA